jgi:hypothetical protein
MDCSFLAWYVQKEGSMNLSERHFDAGERAVEFAPFTFNDVPTLLDADLPPIVLKPHSNMKS